MDNKIKHVLFTVFLALRLLEFSFRIIYSIRYRNFDYITYGFLNIGRFNLDYFNGYAKLRTPSRPEDKLNHGLKDSEYKVINAGVSSQTLYGEVNWA